ncbi:hypothetical protein [Williamsia sp. R60]
MLNVYPPVLALGYTGIRRGEATGLRVRGVNTLRKRLVVRDNAVEVDGMIIEGTTKSHRERTVPVPSFPMGRISALCEGRAGAVRSFVRQRRRQPRD